MGLTGKARSTAGSVRAFPTLGRRMFFSEKRMDKIEEELAQLGRVRDTITDQSAVISESLRRIAALEQQVEGLHAALTGADPQMTLEIVTAVRDEVTRLSIELTEQLNRTSGLLADLGSTATTSA